MNSGTKIYKYFKCVLFAAFCTVLVMIYHVFGNPGEFFWLPSDVSDGMLLQMLNAASKKLLLLKGSVSFCVFFVLGIIVSRLPWTFWDKVYKYRYVIGIIVLAFCVLFSLSGSSLSYWNLILNPGSSAADVTTFRTANPFRSDEFAVNSVLAIAQGENVAQDYPYFSDIVRGTSTDMFIVYGQPVKSFAAIFRPFQLGYLFLGTSRGLSFFWCARLIALILVSFEFGMKLTNQKKKWALMYTLFISFSPIVQWWFAINGLVEMLVFGQLCVLMLNAYMRNNNRKKRILYSLLFFWSGGCYILVFYPAWQVCLGYLFLCLFIVTVIDNRKVFKWKTKTDLPIILITFLIVFSLLGIILYRSADTISAVMNTAYPGKRVSTERFNLLELFAYGYNLFLPFVEPDGVVSWTFIDMFPLGIILSIYVMIRNKKADKYLIGLLLTFLILILLYTCPVPVFILKITLLSQVPAMRIILCFGMINILLLFRSVSLMTKPLNLWATLTVSAVYSFVVCILTKKLLSAFELSNVMLVVIFIIFMTGALVFLLKDKHYMNTTLCVLFGTVLAVCGFMVNPIQKGLDFIFENETVKTVREIAKEDKTGKWIVDTGAFPSNNIPLLAGASTITCTNVYPQTDTWKKIDKNGEYEEIYNRYAHILAQIVPSESESSFELIQADYMKVNISVSDLEVLDVKYVLSERNLEEFSNDEASFSKIDECGQYFVYRIDY